MRLSPESLPIRILVVAGLLLAASAGPLLGIAEPEVPEGLAPCPNEGCPDGSGRPFETIAAGSNGGVAEEQYLRIETRERFAQLWNELHANRIPAPERPDIDFDEYVVLGAFLGERPTGGYGVEIVRICDGRIVVERRSPPEDAMVTQALTAPYHMVLTRAGLEDPVFCEAPREGESAR